MVIMMANTPELTPEPQDFPPVASTSLLEPTSYGASLTTDPAINLTVTMTTLSTSIGIFKQFIMISKPLTLWAAVRAQQH